MPPPDRFGAYRLVRRIGHGGMGEVLEAVAERDVGDVREGARVALKRLLREHRQDDRALRRFRREIEVGRTLRHPALVAILDAGEAVSSEGALLDYFAMELVEGRSLADLLDEGPPLSEPRLQHVALEVASALDVLHSAGVVHRDVKPENILIADDQRVKLADLGVAHLASPELRMTETGAFVGTRLYSAPELFDGRPVEAPADLYSLGVTLYEAASGQCPFRGASWKDVAELHRRHVPPRLGVWNERLSRFFEEVVMTLLQKRPDRRFASAGQLVEVLERGEASDWYQEKLPELDANGRRNVLRRLRAPARPDERLVGRADPLAALRRAESALAQGRGRVLLLEGEAGLGKSRLLAEFVVAEESGPAAFLLGRYRAAAAEQEAQGLGEALLERIGKGRLDLELGRLLPDSPWRADLLARHLRGEPPALEEGQSPLAVLHAAARAVLRTMARERPLVLILEDLHHVGEMQAVQLERLLQLAAEKPLLLILTRRPLGDRPDWLAAPVAEGRVERLDLEPLDREAVERLLAGLLESRSAAADHAAELTRRTRGNPFFVIRLARELKAALQRQAEPDEPTAVLPASLRDLLLDRVKALSPDAAELVRAAAVLGPRFDPLELARVVEREEYPVVAELDRLERETGLVRASGASFEFEHDLLREAVEEALPEALRRSLHGRIAEVHAREHGLDVEAGTDEASESAEFLAHHLLHSRHPERGLPWVVAALERLYRSSRNDRLLALATLAIEVGSATEPAVRARIRLHQANCLELLGRREAHHGCARAAVELAAESRDEPLRLRALSHLSHALEQRGERAKAARLAEEILERAEALGEPLALARARAGLARLRLREGRVGDALELVESALSECRSRAGASTVVARALVVLAQAEMERDRPEAARDALREARRLAHETADPRTEASALGNLARAHLRLGQLDEAEELLREHAAVSTEFGFRQGRLVASLNLASLLLSRGDLGPVRELLLDVLSLAPPKAEAVAAARLLLAKLELVEGRADEATRGIEAMSAEHPDPPPHLQRLLDEVEFELALLEGRAREAELRLQALSPGRGSTAPGAAEDAQQLLRGAAVARLCGRPERETELTDAALDRARAERDWPVLAVAAFGKGRLLARAGRTEEAAPFLREADELTGRLRLADPGPLPSAWLSLLREVEPSAVEVPPGSPILVRAEAHLVLGRAGAGPDSSRRAWRLVDELRSHLPSDDREAFLRRHPLAAEILLDLQAGELVTREDLPPEAGGSGDEPGVR